MTKLCDFKCDNPPPSSDVVKNVKQTRTHNKLYRMSFLRQSITNCTFNVSARLSHQRSNLVYVWTINWIATNMTGSYCFCLSKSHTGHITSSLLQCVLKMFPSSMSTSA